MKIKIILGDLMKKTAIYIRVSTEEQAKEGYSIPAQREKLIAYCKAKEWLIYDIFIDDGYSGKNIERPALERLIEKVNDIDIVLVYKLDRLSRSQKDVLYLIEDVFEPKGIGFVSTLESFDTTTPFGKAMLGILAVFAQLERETIVERSRLGKREQAKQGKWRGGPVPLGYDYKDEKLIVNEYEADIIRKIFDMYIDGMGMDTISKKLNESGYKSKQGTIFRTSKIRSYLNNHMYAGLIPHKGDVFNGEHDPILDEGVFEAVQKIMQDRGSSWRKPSSSLLGGLAVCGECGAKIFRRKVKDIAYYTCYTYHGGPSHMVTAKNCIIGYKNQVKLENEVVAQLKYFEKDKFALEGLIEDILKANSKKIDITPLTSLKRELNDVKKELARWYDAYGKGHMDFDEVNSRIEIAAKKKENIEMRIKDILEYHREVSESNIEFQQLKHIIGNFSCIWENASMDERKKILRGFISKIVVFKNQPPVIEFRIG